MIVLPLDASDELILDAVRQWVDLLAREDYAGALEATWSRPDSEWTPELIRDTIAGYGLPEPFPTGKVFRVTPLVSASGTAPERAVERYDVSGEEQSYPGPPIIGSVFFGGLPLNGEVSDVNATFWLRADNDGLQLELDEIHTH